MMPLSVNMIFQCSTKASWAIKTNKIGLVPIHANMDVTIDRDTGKVSVFKSPN